MSASELQTWVSLYLAVGICAGICAVLAAAVTACELWRGIWRPACATSGDWALALPRLWLHWQRRYLTGMPVILGIALLYAHDLGFSRLLLID
jgi:hypothetical protein